VTPHEARAKSTAAADRPPAAGGRLQADIEDLRGSRRRLVEAATADRRALERALHDGLQQQLAALAIDLRRLAGLMDGQPAAAMALLDEIAANLRDALAEATTLARKIHPPLLDGRGLHASLRSAAEDARVTVTVVAPSDADYPAEVSAAVYWSCVEALSSASPGSEATVSVRNQEGELVFEVAFAGSHPSTGVQRLRDRIEALGGRLSADTAAEGSRIQGWLPLSR
jgi:signal transduction histidine kinase